MKKFGLSLETPLMVAVSGGKDSLALWDVLHSLGYDTKGLYIDLGIEHYSDASRDSVEAFAQARKLPWVGYSLKDTFGYPLPEIRKHTRRKICSVCGLLKRQFLNRLTIREHFSVLAIGHNLDDEAGRLLGNVVRHRLSFLENQYPILSSTHPLLPTKVKPLYRLEAHEIRTYCTLRNIVPVQDKCPFTRGATSHYFQEALDFLEKKMPATKRDFLYSYFDRRNPPQKDFNPNVCSLCGEPTYRDICNVCHLLLLVKKGKEQDSLDIPSVED